MRRKDVHSLAIPAVDISELGVADADGILKHGCKNRLKIAGRAADNLENLGCGRLLLQGFREVGGAAGEVRGALAQFVEQPRVLDGDDGLRGKTPYQLDLPVAERAHLLAIHDDSADQLIVLE